MYSNLNGLRSIAMICILIMHVCAMSASIEVLPSSFHVEQWGDFVFLFMILSSFSMCCGYKDKLLNGDVNIIHFYKRRVIRIFPFFSLMVCLDMLFKHSINSICEGFADFTLLFGFLPNPQMHVVGVGWFIGVIFIFYIFFPFFLFVVENVRKAFLAFICSLFLQILCVSYFSNMGGVEIGRIHFIYCLPYFVLGGILYYYKDISSRIKYSSFFVVFVFLLLFYIFQDDILNDHSQPYNAIALLFVFALLVLFSLGKRIYIFDNIVTKNFNSVSMEIYLCHMHVFSLIKLLHLERFMEGYMLLFIHISLTIMFSYVFAAIIKFAIFPKLLRFFYVK